MSHDEECSGLKTTGVIINRGKATAAQVDAPFLVFDADAWAACTRDRLLEEAAAIESTDLEFAKEARIDAAAITEWLQTHRGIVKTLPPLAIRQNIKPHVVTRDQLHSYLCKILQTGQLLSLHYAKSAAKFLLVADGPQPTLYATAEFRSALRYTGDDIKGEVVSSERLQSLIDEHLSLLQNVQDMVPAFLAPIYQSHKVACG